MGVVQSAILIVWQSPLSRVLVRSRLSLASPTSNPVDWVISTRGGRGETHPCRVPVKERGRARAASASRVPRGVSPRSLEFYLLARGLSSQGCGKWRILGRMQNPLWSPLWSLRYMRYGLCARSRELRDVPESPYSDRTQRTMHTTAREPPGAGAPDARGQHSQHPACMPACFPPFRFPRRPSRGARCAQALPIR